MRLIFKKSQVRNPILTILSILPTVIAIVVIVATFSRNVDSLSGSEFNASNIIDDSIFFNKDSMSVAEIQAFLNAKVPSCDTNGAKLTTYRYNSSPLRLNYAGDPDNGIPPDPYVTTSRAVYGDRMQTLNPSKGSRAPFICLKDYSVNVSARSTDSYCTRPVSGGVKSAAQIIYDAAQSCGVSPKVLIVLLQKEQSLVTDEWPWGVQYDKATGYYCPDDPNRPGWCNPEYAGLLNQVWYAARQYKRYAALPDSYNYAAGRTSFVSYQANSSSCGGTNLTIQNSATAGLYNYTPYQPNQAALNNLYGTGDRCSAYGNRNFWRMYRDWFGSTTGPSFSATYRRQSPYQILNTGRKVEMYFDFENTGTSFWKDSSSAFPGYPPVKLATTNTINRKSNFASSSWDAHNRPTSEFSKVFESDGVTLSVDQQTVFPGQIARFSFDATATNVVGPGVHREFFQPILEGSPNWAMGNWVYQDIGVSYPNYSASYHSQSGYPTIARGSVGYAFFRMKNSGNEPWYDDISTWDAKNPIRLATTGPINRTSTFESNWPFLSRPVTRFFKVLEADGTTLASNQHVALPGQVVEFVFNLKVPDSTLPGVYREDFEVVAEGAPGYKWSIGPTVWMQVTVL